MPPAWPRATSQRARPTTSSWPTSWPGRSSNSPESFAAAVRPGGRVLLSGLLVEQAAQLLSVYGRCGFAFERRVDLETGGAWWRTLLLRRD